MLSTTPRLGDTWPGAQYLVAMALSQEKLADGSMGASLQRKRYGVDLGSPPPSPHLTPHPF